jgi:dihydrofolate synthase/folylpolyglutamate synthase
VPIADQDPSTPRGESAGMLSGVNRLTAIAALTALAERGFDVPPAAVTRGLAAARWPGRLGACPREPRLWWDGAHNECGLRHLVGLWTRSNARTRPPVVVLALSNDKDAAAMLRALHEGFPAARLIATRTRSERAVVPETLAALAEEAGFTAEALPDIPTAVRHGLDVAGEGVVLLTGSLFAVGEAMEAFGGAPGEML